jgi:Uracil DNA glycosylase superfamily
MEAFEWEAALATEMRDVGLDGGRLPLALRLWHAYNEAGVAHGAQDPALFRACPNRTDCWRQAQHRKPPPQDAGVSIPWIGERYPTSRICVVAENLVGYGGKAAHYDICKNKITSLKRNRRKGDRSYMGWATTAFVDAIDRSQRGEPLPPSLPEPREVADAYAACAFLEVVKCAPTGEGSKPTAAMLLNCPPLLLDRELRVLSPSVLILHGSDAQRAVAYVASTEIPTGNPLGRSSIQLNGRQVEVFAVAHPAAHPAARGASIPWKAAYPRLTHALNTRPIGKG